MCERGEDFPTVSRQLRPCCRLMSTGKMHSEWPPSTPPAVLCCRCCFARPVLPAAMLTRRARLRLQVLFQRWLAVLQQAGKQLPFKAENWETVTGGG